MHGIPPKSRSFRWIGGKSEVQYSTREDCGKVHGNLKAISDTVRRNRMSLCGAGELEDNFVHEATTHVRFWEQVSTTKFSSFARLPIRVLLVLPYKATLCLSGP